MDRGSPVMGGSRTQVSGFHARHAPRLRLLRGFRARRIARPSSGTVEEEVLDAYAADPGKRRPSRERGGRTVCPRHQPSRHPVAHGLLARDRVEGENLRTAAVPRRARHPAHRGRGSPSELRIAVGLDLDPHRKVTGHAVQQVVEEHGRLVRRGGVVAAQARVSQIAPRRLMRPAAQTPNATQPRLVQQDQSSVGGQAGIGLELAVRFEPANARARGRPRANFQVWFT